MLGNLRGDMQSMGQDVQDISDDMQSMRDRVDTLEDAEKAQSAGASAQVQSAKTGGQPPDKVRRVSSALNTSSSVQSTSAEVNDTNYVPWCDRDVDESMDFSTDIHWPNDDEEEEGTGKGVKLFKVSDKISTLINNCFSTAAPNTVRRQWRDKYGAPNLNATACPNMDKVIKDRLPALTKSKDRQMAKQQSLTLDAVGPITHILEEAAKGQLNQKTTIEAAQTALKLLGNASMHANRERRKNAIQSLNSRLSDMAEDDSLYKAAPPMLFGEGFCKKAKERDEELKCLNQAAKSFPKPNRGGTLFRGGRANYQQSRGRGQFYRGQKGRFQRHQPYQKNDWSRRGQDDKQK